MRPRNAPVPQAGSTATNAARSRLASYPARSRIRSTIHARVKTSPVSTASAGTAVRCAYPRLAGVAALPRCRAHVPSLGQVTDSSAVPLRRRGCDRNVVTVYGLLNMSGVFRAGPFLRPVRRSPAIAQAPHQDTAGVAPDLKGVAARVPLGSTLMILVWCHCHPPSEGSGMGTQPDGASCHGRPGPLVARQTSVGLAKGERPQWWSVSRVRRRLRATPTFRSRQITFQVRRVPSPRPGCAFVCRWGGRRVSAVARAGGVAVP